MRNLPAGADRNLSATRPCGSKGIGGRSLGRPEAEIRVNIVSRDGDAGLRLYLKAVDIGNG